MRMANVIDLATGEQFNRRLVDAREMCTNDPARYRMLPDQDPRQHYHDSVGDTVRRVGGKVERIDRVAEPEPTPMMRVMRAGSSRSGPPTVKKVQ